MQQRYKAVVEARPRGAIGVFTPTTFLFYGKPNLTVEEQREFALLVVDLMELEPNHVISVQEVSDDYE